jgi:hypothetical protein
VLSAPSTQSNAQFASFFFPGGCGMRQGGEKIVKLA